MSSAVLSISGLRRIVWGSQLRVNMVAGVATACASAVVVAYSYRLYLQQLGYELYGLWLLLATVLTLIHIGSLGLGPALAKVIAEDKERGTLDLIAVHIRTAITAMAASGLVFLVVCLLFRQTIVAHLGLTPANAELAYRLLPYVVAVSVYALIVDTVNTALSGLGRVDIQHYTQTGMNLVTMLVSMVFLAYGYNIWALLIGQAMACLALHLVTMTILHRRFQVKGLWHAQWSRTSFSRLTSIGWGLSGSALIWMLLTPLNRFLLSRLTDVSLIPIYELSFNATMRLRNIAEAGVRALMPEISRLSVKRGIEDVKRIRRLHGDTLFMLLTLGGTAYLALFIAAPFFLRAWLGSAYVPELSLGFRIALVGSFLSLLGVPAFYVLLGLGRARPVLLERALHGGTSAALALGVAWVSPLHVTPVMLLGAGVCGMGLSTGYLLNQYQTVMHTLPVKDLRA